MLTVTALSGKLFFMQSISANLFLCVAILMLSILQFMIKLLFDSDKAEVIPRNEKIWIFPIISIVLSLLFLVLIFYIPSLFDRSFWSNVLEVPTIYFAHIVNMLIILVFFSIFFFAGSVFFWCKNLENQNNNVKKWKIVKGTTFFVLFSILSILLFYISNYKKSSVLYSYANIYSLQGKMKRAKKIFSKIAELNEKGRIEESSLYQLFNMTYLTKNKESMYVYLERLKRNYPKSVYLDDISFRILKFNKFDSDDCNKFMLEFSDSPWCDDVMLQQLLNYRRSNKPEMAKKMRESIRGLSRFANIIIENKKHIVAYRTSSYFELMENKL